MSSLCMKFNKCDRLIQRTALFSATKWLITQCDIGVMFYYENGTFKITKQF